MEHLALEIFDQEGTGSQYANLPEDTSITITDTSEVFDTGDVWSHNFTLNIPANLHIFGTSGELHGSRLHEQVNKRRARLWVMGLPLYYGYLRLADEVDVDENGDIDISFESGQKTFEDLIDGMNARDVPLLSDIRLGVAVWRERLPHIRITYYLSGKPYRYSWPADKNKKNNYTSDVVLDVDLSTYENRMASRWPKYVVHSGTFKDSQQNDYIVNKSDTINTDFPYDDSAPNSHPYCNVLFGYQTKINENGSEKTVRGYTIHELNDKTGIAWPNSAPCFYVMYWVRALMTYLGVNIDINQMQGVEDLRRLFMMNTLCAYDEPDSPPSDNPENPHYLKLSGIEFPMSGSFGVSTSYNIGESAAVITNQNVTLVRHETWGATDLKEIAVNIKSVEKIGLETIVGHPAFATSDNFPNTDAKNVIEALENAFGVRFLFDRDYKRVRIVLLRDIFRSEGVVNLECDIIEQRKAENNINGFMMSYQNEEDTAFMLPMFDKMLNKKHDTDTSDVKLKLTREEYYNIIKAASSFNKNIYYANDGNTYAYKVDEEATRYRDLYPSLFEVAGFMDAVEGECSGEDSTYKEINLGFTPLIVNDANMVSEKQGLSKQRFFVFVNEEMEPTVYQNAVKGGGVFEAAGDIFFTGSASNLRILYENSTNYSKSEFSIDLNFEGYIFETIYPRLYDNYKSNNEGISPVEKHDWGLTLGIMRGSGNDATIKYENDGIENEDNDYWELTPGSSATTHPDTCDDYGRVWNYDGQEGYSAVCATPAEAKTAMNTIWPETHFDLNNRSSENYLTGYLLPTINDDEGNLHTVLIAGATKDSGVTIPADARQSFFDNLKGKTVAQMMSWDAANMNLIIEIDSSRERAQTLLSLQKLAYAGGGSVIISGGTDVRDGRFSLKLRAEKPNPYFDKSQPESDSNRRYLEIENPNLRQRGLMDQFHKEESYWWRNARIAKMKVRMELAQLLAIDKTVRQRVGDITGFIKKMQFTVSNKTGLSPVDLEMFYI